MAENSSSGAGWSETCPICLESVKDEAFLDHCFHTFCYQCITKWFRFISKKGSRSLLSFRCPLCKTESFSIIHGFDGETFLRQYVNKESTKRYLSEVHEFRMRFYAREDGITKGTFDVQQYWKRHKYTKKNIWLQLWLRREIQTLIQDDDVDIIVHHIEGVSDSFFKRCKEQTKIVVGKVEQMREEFRLLLTEAVRPFLAKYTDQFVHELELFLASGLNIEAYDRVCLRHLALPCDKASDDQEESFDQSRDQYLLFLDEDTDRIT